MTDSAMTDTAVTDTAVTDSAVTDTGATGPARPLSVLIAGGGTAGHIEPALAVADAIRAAAPQTAVVALGTARGLETTLVPQRGYPLELIRPVPLPRKPSKDLLTLPVRMRGAVREVRAVLREHHVDVVVGFGGYVALPAYLAARGRVPVVIHEANARAGLANKVGARWATAVFAAVAGSGLARAEVVGIPVRQSVAHLDRAALRAEARAFFGLDPTAPTLLVSGGSQGAVRINEAVGGAAAALAAAGIGVLHAYGRKNEIAVHHAEVPGAPAYVGVPYLERMDLAFAAADLVIGRSGAMTVAETGAVGLPAIYVPLPHGNGEQSLNARGQVDAGSAIVVPDAEFDADLVRRTVIPLLAVTGGAVDPAAAKRFAAMLAAAQQLSDTDVGAALAQRVLQIAADGRSGRSDVEGARR